MDIQDRLVVSRSVPDCFCESSRKSKQFSHGVTFERKYIPGDRVFVFCQVTNLSNSDKVTC